MSFAALYLHIPFCVRRCRYCDFPTAAIAHGDPLVARYAAALATLVKRIAGVGLLREVATAYIGGGTPTMAGESLPGLVGAVRASCPRLSEFTTEANPESLAPGLPERLAAAGATRVSLGIQSLDDAELAALGRVHDAGTARRAARRVCAAGLDLSCDLMCGIPLQTAASWESSLRGAIGLGAGHLSCYPLILEEGTPLEAAVSRGEEAVADDDGAADLMVAAERILESSGFRRYEVASYALPGKACRHNIAYWTGLSYLGVGASAASMMSLREFAALAEALPLLCVPESVDGADDPRAEGMPGAVLAKRMDAVGEEGVARVRIRMAADPRELIRAVDDGTPLRACVETLSRREVLAEDLMLGMRMSAGVGAPLLGRARGLMGGRLDEALSRVVGLGLARRTPDGGLAPTEQGWLLGNELYGAMWDLAEDAS